MITMGRRQVTAGLLALAGGGGAGSARAQQHWLIGTWVGRTENVRARVNADRTLTVKKVSADGTSAVATFNAGGVVVHPKITIAGERITFVSGSDSAGATYELTHRGNELVGIRTGNAAGSSRARQTTISLVRQ